MLQKIKESVDFISGRFSGQPKTAVILGTGLGSFVKELEVLGEISFSDIPGFPSTSVEGHKGKLIHARFENQEVYVLQGRLHFYEGYPMDIITYPVRVLKYLGVDTLLLTNAAGGMNENFMVGDLMIIEDHINMMPNPLIGKHIDEFGERFPDMSIPYSKSLIEKALQTGGENSIKLFKGVYVAVTGPTYETPAEYKYFRIIGGDAVGMSTVPEVVVANQMGMRCFAISVITDLGVPGKIEFLTHEMVQRAGEVAEPKLALIIKNLIKDS